MKKQLLSILLLVNIIHFKAQEKEIDVILIQGKFLSTPLQRVSENIEVITKKDIEASPARNIDELLQQFSGLDIQRRGPHGVQSDISLRGGTFGQVLILLNGIQMNDSQTAHNSLNIPIDLSSIERIEVIKGPAARRFGQNAFAGAINIITKTSSKEKARIWAEGADFSTYSLGLNGTFGSEGFQNLFQTNAAASGGYRYNTDYEIRNVFYQGKIAIPNGNIGVQAGFLEKKFGANGFYGSPTAVEQYEEIQTSVVSASYHQKFNNLGLHSALYWRRGQDMYLWNRKRPELYRNMHIGNNAGGEINLSYLSPIGTTGVGVELRSENLASNNLRNHQRFITQVFLEHNFSFFSDRLKIIPGISWIRFSSMGDYFYPGLDVGFSFNNQHKIYANIAKVHRTPTYTDLYYKSRTEEGNENLVSERALSMEAGYSFNTRNFNVKASVFRRNTDNMIDFVKNLPHEKWKAENIISVDIKGAELSAEKHLPSIQTTFHAAYTYLHNNGKYSANFSKYTAENLKHQFIAKMENKLFQNIYNQTIYRYQERQTTGKSYNLIDEKLSYRRKNSEVYLLISNLTNTHYTEAFGVPMPGRWFHIGASFTIE